MVPDDPGSWCYNFQGAKFRNEQKYSLRIGTPLEFYHEAHRSNHFLTFTGLEEAGVGERFGHGVANEADVEDFMD